MSVILTQMVRNHIDLELKKVMYVDDCGTDEAKVYSRGLVGICLASLSGLNYCDIVEYITDGTKDNGIDGAYYDALKNKLYLIQSKWSNRGSGTIGTGDVRKFIAGMYDLLSDGEWNKFNDRVNAIKNDLSVGIKNDPSIVLVAAYNSDNDISDECQDIINKVLDETNLDSQDLITFRSFGLKSLVRTIRAIKAGAKSDVEVNLLNWGEQETPFYSIYGKISCADIAEWHKEHGSLLFTENIRSTLSESNINLQIASTLMREPEQFWYFNNGLTAIADRIKRKTVGLGNNSSGNWKIENLKVVNGAQTTGAIAEVYAKRPDVVKQAFVQIKIISLENAPLDIAKKITTATNTQNRVEPKDFLALDPYQESLADGFKSIGIQYCYRRGEKVIDRNIGIDVIELALALAVSKDINSVVIAKRNVGSLTDPDGYYSKLFVPGLKANLLWGTVQRWRIATELVARLCDEYSGRESQLAVHGNRFIEHLLLMSEVDPITVEKVRTIHSRLKSIIDSSYGTDCYLAVLFKNAKKCSQLKTSLQM